MTACTACGHDPLTGRYCSRCGAPAGAGVTPEPTPIGTPPPARFPMYVDELVGPDRPAAGSGSRPTPGPAPTTAQAPVPASSGSSATPAPRGGSHAAGGPRPRPSPWQWGLGIVALLAVAGVGLMVFGSGGTEDAAASDPGEQGAADSSGADEDAPATTSMSPATIELLTPGEVEVPGAAGPSQDNDGNRVTYDAGNLVDEDPRTAWRMPGDASGAVLTFRFDDPVTVTDVGLINGYAKKDPPNDWYLANRRVLSVEWVFGDGSSVTQRFTDEREVQRTEIDPVETDVVELRLTEVSAPDGRDYTAISEISLSGSR